MPHANRGSVCSLVNFQWCGELCFADAAIQEIAVPRELPCRAGVGNYEIMRFDFVLTLKRSPFKRG